MTAGGLRTDSAAFGDASNLLSTLRRLLSRHLGRAEEAIDPHQSFDEMGMDSVDGVLLSGELSDCLGIDLPPEFLLKYRSLDHVREGLLTLRDGGVEADDPPEKLVLFAFPGGAGRNTKMSRLADYDARLVVEIVPFGEWRDWLIAGCDLSSLVDRACDWIEAWQPTDGLKLGGHSLGGQIAFAVALALRARGRTIDGLYLFDSSAERRKFGKAGIRAMVVRTLTRFRRMSARIDSQSSAVNAREQFVDDDGSIKGSALLKSGVELLELAAARALLVRWPADRLPSLTDRFGIRVDRAIRMKLLDIMCRSWTTNPLGNEGKFPITLFRALSPGSQDLGWRHLCPALRIVCVDGSHGSMLEAPHIPVLAEKMLSAMSADAAADTTKCNVLASV